MLAALVMVCVLVAGLRVTSCCRCRWHLSAFAHSVTGPSNFQSVLLRSRPKTQMLLAVFGTCLTKKYSCRVSSTPSDPLVDARPPSCIVVESSRLTVRFLYAMLQCAAVWLVVAPASAHSHIDCALLHCPGCLQNTHESQVCVPDAPPTTQLYYHADALRPYLAARRYHSLGVSPALHPPERPTPLTAKPDRVCRAACLANEARGLEVYYTC